MTTRASTSSIVLGVVLSLGLAFTSVATAQQKKEQASVKVGPIIQAAIAAGKNKQFDVAVAKLQEAEKAAGKTPYDQFKIYETYEFLYGSQRKYVELAAVKEKMLQSPQYLAPAKAELLPKEIAQSYANASQNAKAQEFAAQWLKTHPNDLEMLVMVGQIHYQSKEYKQCREIMNNIIAQAEKSGGEPKENWLQISQQCAIALDDNEGVTRANEKLVRYHPKAEWWLQYATKLVRQEKSDSALFQWRRLLMDVSVMKDPSEFIEYAQTALTDFGSGPEAQRVAEVGFTKQILGADPKHKARHENILNKAREASKEAKAKVAQLQAQAEKSATGEIDAQVGMIQFGSDQYDQASKSFETAIKKGGLKATGLLKQDLGTIKMSLGIAQFKRGQRDQARATFKSMESDPAYAKVAAAWVLRTYS